MDKHIAELVLAKLRNFWLLERRSTTEAGWIALHFNVTARKAEKMIAAARAQQQPPPPTRSAAEKWPFTR